MSLEASSWEGQSREQLVERWAGRQVHLYTRIDSTNTRAKELADSGVPPGTVVVADEQLAGRGLASRRWHSPPGTGLYLSLILEPLAAPNPQLIPLLAGLGVAGAIERLTKETRLGVKWPNDIIVADRKAGGVLSEASWTGRKSNYIVVGVGVNVGQRIDDFPEPLRGVATSLAMATGRAVSRLQLADLVISEVESRCRELPVCLDDERVRQFSAYDWLRDRRCRIDEAGATSTRGTAAGIAADGALLLRLDHGAVKRVTSGRVIADQLPIPDY